MGQSSCEDQRAARVKIAESIYHESIRSSIELHRFGVRRPGTGGYGMAL